jgi:hypothetical protein
MSDECKMQNAECIVQNNEWKKDALSQRTTDNGQLTTDN